VVVLYGVSSFLSHLKILIIRKATPLLCSPLLDWFCLLYLIDVDEARGPSSG
jgi:hypothetical protein